LHVDPPGQLTGAPDEHEPAAQTSPVVQRLPSLQGAVLFTCWQLPAEQESSVQGLASSQLAVVCWQPSRVSQVSVVQALASSQLTGVAVWQVPSAPHVSFVQAFASLQSAFVVQVRHPAIGRKSQTPAEHESIVHALLSLQFASTVHAVAVGKPSHPMRPPVGPAVSAGEPAAGR
jgi:hypothetical protein